MNFELVRMAVVDEAMSWLRTPYHHHAGLKGVGVDCIWLLIRCYQHVGIVAKDFDPGEYSPEWFLHRSEELYMNGVAAYARRLLDGEEQQPGDIALFKIGKCVSHGGILVTHNKMVHANRKSGEVELAFVEQCELSKKFHSYWTPFK
jgi:cell wall-associated NlpC family hydrolase